MRCYRGQFHVNITLIIFKMRKKMDWKLQKNKWTCLILFEYKMDLPGFV